MECMICTEDLLSGSVGELDCCDHSFCAKCILKWAEKDSRCPACRGRFHTVTEKILDVEQPALGCTNDEEMKHSKQMLGKIIEVHDIPERNQRPDMDDPDFYFSDAEDDPMNEVFCVECGGGDDEHNLLLCDGCDCACHTYCANLESIPEDEWYCHSCTEERESTSQGRLSAIIGNPQAGGAAAAAAARVASRTPRRLVTRARADERGGRRRSTPGDAVDLITPEGLPASSERPRRRAQRRDRRGPPAGGQGVEIGTTADFLAALGARANSRTAGDAPSHDHRLLENMRQDWGRIRRGQADFSTLVDLTSPHSNSVSGQSSATQTSLDAGQPSGAAGQASSSGQHSRRARIGHASDADAAFAALDDAMDLRPSSTMRTAAGGAPSRARGGGPKAGASSSADLGKRKRSEAEDDVEQERPAIREPARQLRRPAPRERSGLLRSFSRPSSGQEPPQAQASAQGHVAASLSPRGPFTAGGRHLQRVDSGQVKPLPPSKSLHEHSSGLLHRSDSLFSLQRPGSGGSPRPSHSTRPAQSMERQGGTGLSSVPLRQRAGAQPRESAFAGDPLAHQPSQAPHVTHHMSGPPEAGSHRHEPSHLPQMQHQQWQRPERTLPPYIPTHLAQHPLLFHRQGVSLTPGTGGRRETLHGSISGSSMHTDQQAPPAASHGPLSLPSPTPQLQHARGYSSRGPQDARMHIPSQPAAPAAAQAHMQHSEASHGTLSSSAPGRQNADVIRGESAHRPDTDKREGVQGIQSSEGEEGTGSAVPSGAHSQKGQAHAAALRLSKKEAFAAVKPLLKSLLDQELLVRPQFKDAAKRAVHLLYEGGAHNAQAAVWNALSSMGLEPAASRVSQEGVTVTMHVQ